ncbi:MAG: hypothetical protein ACTSYI_07245, partial [Promethearchaeota archaeon]
LSDDEPSKVFPSGGGDLKNSLDMQSRKLIGQILSHSISESNFNRLLNILKISQNGVQQSTEFGFRLNSLRIKFVSWLLLDRKETEVTLDNFFVFLESML